MCQKKLKQHWIQNSGTIGLNDDCLVKQDKLQINSHDIFPASIWEPIVPIVDPKVFGNITNINVRHFDIKYQKHSDTLSSIQGQIHQLRQLQQLPNDELQQYSIQYHYVVIYTLLLIVLAVGLYTYLHWRHAKISGIGGNTPVINNFELNLRRFRAGEDVGR